MEYNHMINKAIISKYKKAIDNIEKKIDIDRKRILKSKEVQNRLKINDANKSFIILKHHEENFNSNLTIGLENPAQNEWEVLPRQFQMQQIKAYEKL